MNETWQASKCIRRSLLLAALLIPLTAVADGDSVEFDVDDPPVPDHPLAKHLRGGAKLVIETEYLDQRDLDRSRDDRRLSTEPELEIVLAYAPDPNLQLITELELKRKYWFDHPDGRRGDAATWELKELYLLIREFAPGWRAQLGRQRFRDRREWLYDERLDGVQLVYSEQRWGLMLAATREEAFERDLLNAERADQVDNFELRWRRSINGDSDLDLYWLRRDSHEADNEDLDYVGIHSSGQFVRGHDYWIDSAVIDGARRQRSVRGYGVDLGWTYRFEGERRHHLTLGYAYGSGDDGSERDSRFRQTGLQDNTARLQGLTRVKYYGELLDPELSNLQVATLGWGMRPTADRSIELLYHHYRQVEADDRLRGATLVVDPNGVNRDIGEELDLVLATRPSKGISLSLVVGRFEPGRAFAATADPAWFGEVSLSLSF